MAKSVNTQFEFKVTYSISALRIINQMAFSLNDNYGEYGDDIEPITCECSFHNVPLSVIQEIHVWSVLNNCEVTSRKGLVSHYNSSLRYDEVSIKNANGKGICGMYSNSY